MTFPAASLELARRVLAACEATGHRVATAESCTGGLIIACLTEIAGASNVVERGYVTYDNRAKEEMLGIPNPLIEQVGAVSEEVALAMAEGACRLSGACLAIAVTGIAGPGGATPTKPVGLVHIALATAGGRRLHERHVFPGDRAAVRAATVDAALALMLRGLE
jgi:nicotinamide-nucleotide amidase